MKLNPTTARLMLIAAALLWSTSGVFMRLLQQPTSLKIDIPALTPLQIAFHRSLFAGIALLFLVRSRHVDFRPVMGLMVFSFGIMTALYLSALGRGTVANAILLQNTAPVWVYFLGVYILHQAPDRRTLVAVLLAMVGAFIVVAGNWPRNRSAVEQGAETQVLLMAAGSGFFYAIVVLCLKTLHRFASAWLMTLNLLGGTLVIAAFAYCENEWSDFIVWSMMPSPRQLVFLATYGIIQLALPYLLFAHALKIVSPQEAGIITLLEPVLNPVWSYLVTPEKDTPTLWTILGGVVILGALAWRYWPRSGNIYPFKGSTT